MDKDVYKNRRKSQISSGKVAPTGQVRKFDAGLVIAGHSELYRDSQSRTVLKALQPSPRGEIEEKFYTEITTSTLPELKLLRTLCPRFYGTVEHNNTGFLRLEDLTRPFQNPCIIDIKMGKVTWDPDATDAKRKREESKYPPLQKTGFQLLGCRIPGNGLNVANNATDHIKLDKKWGRGLLYEELTSGLARFMSGAGTPERQNMARVSILEKLYIIRDWFLAQNSYRFFASSLLILYESYSKHDLGSQGSSDSEDDRSSLSKLRVDVRMIDFAHVYPAENGQIDTNYVFGLNNLIQIFEILAISEEEKTQAENLPSSSTCQT